MLQKSEEVVLDFTILNEVLFTLDVVGGFHREDIWYADLCICLSLVFFCIYKLP